MHNDDPILYEFLNRKLKPATKKRYNYILKRYVESTGLSLSELIQEAEEDEDNGIRLRKRRIKKHLDNHIQYLESLDYSVKNLRLNISSIRVFYNFFEIQLPKIYLPEISNDKTTDDIPGYDEIREVISHANQKYTAIILLMASSGMGSAEALSLQIHDLLKSAKKDPSNIDELSDIEHSLILEWEVTRIKTGQQYYTFSSPETTRAIMLYLKKQPAKSVEDHIFRTGRGPKTDSPLNTVSLQHYFKRINDKCQFGHRGRQRYFKSHNLRKFFATTCESHIPHMATRHMMGHKFGSVESAYFLRNQKALRDEYNKVVGYLAILEPVTVIDRTEELEAQLKEQEERHQKELEEERKRQDEKDKEMKEWVKMKFEALKTQVKIDENEIKDD